MRLVEKDHPPADASRENLSKLTSQLYARLAQPKRLQPVMQVLCNVNGVSDILKRTGWIRRLLDFTI